MWIWICRMCVYVCMYVCAYVCLYSMGEYGGLGTSWSSSSGFAPSWRTFNWHPLCMVSAFTIVLGQGRVCVWVCVWVCVLSLSLTHIHTLSLSLSGVLSLSLLFFAFIFKLISLFSVLIYVCTSLSLSVSFFLSLSRSPLSLFSLSLSLSLSVSVGILAFKILPCSWRSRKLCHLVLQVAAFCICMYTLCSIYISLPS